MKPRAEIKLRAPAIAVCLLPVFLFLLSACQPKTKQQLYNKAMELLKKGDARSAAVYLEDALQKDPSYTPARLQLAAAFERIGKPASAQAELARVLKTEPGLVSARIELAKTYLEQSKPGAALGELGKIHVTKTVAAQVAEDSGWAYALKHDYPAALASFQNAISAGGDPVKINLRKAGVYLVTGNVAKAMQEISGVLRKDPDNHNALHLLASIQIKENNIAGALQTYARAGQKDLLAQFNTGLLLMGEKKYGQAQAIGARVAKGWPHMPQGYLLQGISLFIMQKYVDASGFLRQANSMAQIPAAHYYLGLCLYNMNDQEEALTEMDKAVSLDPSLASAQLVDAYILLKLKRTNDAVAHLKKFIASGTDNAMAHDLLGNAYILEGKYEKGQTEIDKAISLNPSLAGPHAQKAALLLGSGKLPEAETELKTAVSLDPGALGTRLLLASYYENRGQYAKAMDLLKKGLTGQKTDAPIYVLMAKALGAQNNSSGAEAYLLKAESVNPDYAASYMGLSSLYVQMGEMGKAASQMEALYRRDPGKNLGALTGAASLLEADGEDAAAESNFKLAAKSGNPAGYLALASYYLREKRLAEALSVLNGGISKNPSIAALYELKSNVLLAEGNSNGAVQVAQALEKTDPKAGAALLLKASASSRKPVLALNIVKQKLARSPGDLAAMAQLSGLYMSMKEPALALGEARQIIASVPGAPVGYMQLALIQSGSSLDEAIETLRGPRVPKSPAVSIMLGDFYFRKKAFRQALTQFARAERLAPRDMTAVYQQAVTLQVMGQNGPAAAAYRKALGMVPGYVPALNNLAYIYAKDKKTAAALRLASLAYVSAPQDGNVTDTYGLALLENGRTAKALGVLKKASALMPGNPSIFYHLALAYNASGNRPMAVSSLRKCLGMGAFRESGQARAMLQRLTGGRG